MQKRLEREVRRRAVGRCEYCHIPEQASDLRHVIDHIVARQHRGRTTLANLALSCGRCNQSKGPNLSGIDPGTGRLARLFNPRQDAWPDHFRWEGAALSGRTAIGRATIYVLAINTPLRIAARRALIEEGFSLD